jgi:hypothetical protein
MKIEAAYVMGVMACVGAISAGLSQLFIAKIDNVNHDLPERELFGTNTGRYMLSYLYGVKPLPPVRGLRTFRAILIALHWFFIAGFALFIFLALRETYS